MRAFLDAESIGEHMEYLRGLKLRYSILEKSIDGIRGKSVGDIMKMKLSRGEREDIMRLLPEIRLHEIFFNSFSGNRFVNSELVREGFGSEGAFLNELYRLCMRTEYGFVSVCVRGREIYLVGGGEYPRHFQSAEPILCIDLCEHAYFSDYRFCKDEYLQRALMYFDISRLDFDEKH